MKNFFDEHPFLLMLSGLISLLFVLGIGGNEFERYQCNQYSKITGKQTVYSNFDVCYVMTESGLQRWDEYKIRYIARDGLK